MNNDVATDLKQFITAAINQAIDGLDERFTHIDTQFKQMALRFDDLELRVDTIADAHAIMLEDHDLAINALSRA